MSDEKTAKRRVTLRDVAQAAGVSLKTASNVINGSGRMTDETRAKVESVIKDLDYRVNVAARNLNRDHTGFITLAVPSLIPPYLAELANRTIEAARQRNYSVYVTTYAEGSAKGARDLLKKFNSTVSDGMILSMSEVENISPDDLKVDFPLVIVGARTTWGIVDHVTPDDVSAAAMAAGYLYIPLTTMDSRLDWTAPTAVNRILGRIDGSITEPELLTTESQVIARASTC